MPIARRTAKNECEHQTMRSVCVYFANGYLYMVPMVCLLCIIFTRSFQIQWNSLKNNQIQSLPNLSGIVAQSSVYRLQS